VFYALSTAPSKENHPTIRAYTSQFKGRARLKEGEARDSGVRSYNGAMIAPAPKRGVAGRRARNRPICAIREANYDSDERAIRSIRFAVFVDEQNVPPEIEMDDRDPHCIHLLAFVGEKAVGTARIDIEHGGKIGRLAVLKSWRKRGIGRSLMERCHEIAGQHGLTEVWCNAQVVAVPFYASLGYHGVGDRFEEAGIEHQRMTKTLKGSRTR
jgi:predicted GNAT family N-acyltransferase